MKNNQKGFGVAVVLLGIAVVVLAGAVGWMVYDRNQNKPVKSDNTTPSQQAAPNTPQATSTTQASTQKYFTIKEWGIRAPYDGQDTLTYDLADNANVTSVISADLAAKDKACSKFGAGQIRRLSADDYASPAQYGSKVSEDYKSNPDHYVVIGKYYYSFMHDQAACGSGVTAEQQNQANATTSALIKKFEAVPSP